jgi:hypothetical protein
MCNILCEDSRKLPIRLPAIGWAFDAAISISITGGVDRMRVDLAGVAFQY